MSPTPQNTNGTHRVPGPDIFPDERPQPRGMAVGVEVAARRADGWRVTLQFTLPLDKLDAALDRLGDLGYTPDIAPETRHTAHRVRPSARSTTSRWLKASTKRVAGFVAEKRSRTNGRTKKGIVQ